MHICFLSILDEKIYTSHVWNTKYGATASSLVVSYDSEASYICPEAQIL